MKSAVSGPYSRIVDWIRNGVPNSPIPNYYDVSNSSNGYTNSSPIDEQIQGTNSNGQILDCLNTRHLSSSIIHREHSLCLSENQFTPQRTAHSHCSENMIIQDCEESLKCHTVNCRISISNDINRNCSSISNCSSNENLYENIISDISLKNKTKSCLNREKLTSVFSRLERSINELSSCIDSLEKNIDT